MLRIARGDKGPQVSTLKAYLIKLGYPLNDEGSNKGVFGPKVEAAVADFQDRNGLEETGIVDQVTLNLIIKQADEKRTPALPVQPVNPAYVEAKKYAGKGEHDKAFVAWLSKYWPKVGLPGYKTIIGTAFAWCGLFFAAMHTDVGLSVVKGAAGAKNWRNAGIIIDWKKDGIPQGAEVQIDHDGDCKGGGNHITWADGACAPADLLKPGAKFPGYGGNQANMVKRSMYGVREICSVVWPHELQKPGPVTKSIDCAGTGGKESTR